MKRRLAAVFAGDVLGYSRLIREDEASTLAALKAYRVARPARRSRRRIAAVAAALVLVIVSAPLAFNLSAEEQDKITGGQSTNVEAREAFQKGWEHYSRFTPEDNAKAAEQFKRAVELDPEYGQAYSALRWQENLGINTFRANQMALEYMREGEKRASSLTHVAASQIHLYNKRHDKASTEAERAVELDPNDPEAHLAMGLAMITTGRPEAGLEFTGTALRLNRSHPTHYVLAHGMAYFAMDDLEQAAAVLKEALDRDPGAVELAPLLAATYAHLGQREDARAVVQQWRPELDETSLERIGFAYHVPYAWAHNEREVETRLRDGLFIAGLPLDVTIDSSIEALQHEDTAVRKRAAKTLGWFGPMAVEAVPALINALADEEKVAKQAVIALGKIGPAAEAAIPELSALKDTRFAGHQAKEALKKIARK
jgi:tetratricopeptide (TPR) repeat protein